ncbi:class I SAM-dependent methyltransferase [Georgenia sp. MJ173]|uniref:class I SAM-dependent methyltransferase n=1 Tax=Georgenia sunbinii TaxID=3117728 RepID=UPI002F26D132
MPDAPPLPGSGGWALSASTLLGLWDVVTQERPATIVECGSGSSTLWLGYAAREIGGARVVALEHKAAFARRTEDLLTRHGLQGIADVRHAPLSAVEIDGETYRWYDRAQVSDLGVIDLLLVDGPPKGTGPMARFPAVPLLRQQLRPGALVVVDDAHRADEQEAVRRWSEHAGLELVRQLSRDATLFRVG